MSNPKSEELGPKTRPLLLGGSLVRAVLRGEKTQTRRPVKPRPLEGRAGSETEGMWGWPMSLGLYWSADPAPPKGVPPSIRARDAPVRARDLVSTGSRSSFRNIASASVCHPLSSYLGFAALNCLEF